MNENITHGWAEGRKKASEAVSGDFVKMKRHGDFVEIAFVGDLITFEVHWDGSNYVPYDPDKHDKKNVRHKCNAYNLATGQMQIYEFSAELMGKLGEEIDMNRLTSSAYRIKRDDESIGRTTYHVTYLRTLGEDERVALLDCKLHELRAGGTVTRSDGREPPPDDIPPTGAYDE